MQDDVVGEFRVGMVRSNYEALEMDVMTSSEGAQF